MCGLLGALLAALSCTVPLATADVTATGPYDIEVLEFNDCDDEEYPGIRIDVKLVVDNDNSSTMFQGDITTKYDMLEENVKMDVYILKWGSTGGWSPIYNLTLADTYSSLMEKFPNCFDRLFGSMGVTERSMPPDTYHIKGLHRTKLKLEKIDSLIYGKYKLYGKQSKGADPLGCLSGLVSVTEAAAGSNGPNGR